MHRSMSFCCIANYIAIATFMVITNLSYAYDTSSSQDWKFSGNLYLWAVSIGGETSAGDDIDIGFDDVWDNLNVALMGWGAARNGNWVICTDIQYAVLEGNDNTTADLVGQPVEARLNLKMTQWLAQVAGGYTVSRSEKHMLDVFAGARYFYQKSEFEFRVGSEKLEFNDSKDVIDGIIGVNSHLNLNDNWYLSSYVDVGTGDSEFTWQGMATLGYKLNNFDAIIGYRHIYWDFEDDEDLGEDYNNFDLSGPLAGITFRF